MIASLWYGFSFSFLVFRKKFYQPSPLGFCILTLRVFFMIKNAKNCMDTCHACSRTHHSFSMTPMF